MITNYSHNDINEEAIHLGNNATVFQAEVFHLIFAETKNKSVVINCDSQAVIMALDNTKIKSKTTLEAVLVVVLSTSWEKTTRFLLDEYQHTAAI